MRNIRIGNVKLTNVKGVASKEHDFAKTPILKDYNETGKSTILNAITWLLTGGKDLSNSDFKPQCLSNKDGYVAEMDVTVGEGELYTLKIDNKKYYINDVKYTKSKYIEALNNITGHTNIVRLINGKYITEGLHWKEAREIVVKELLTVNDESIMKLLIESKGFEPGLVQKAKSIFWNIQTARDNMNSWKMKVADTTSQLYYAKNESNNTKDVATIETLRKEKLFNIESKNKELKELKEQSLSLKSDINEINAALAKNNKDIAGLTRLKTTIPAEIAGLEELLDSKSKEFENKSCGSCGQALSQQHIDAMVKENQELLEFAPGKLNELKEHLKVANDTLVVENNKHSQILELGANTNADYQAVENKIRDLVNEIKTLENNVREYDTLLKGNDNADKLVELEKLVKKNELEFQAWNDIVEIITTKGALSAELVQASLKETFPSFDIKLVHTNASGTTKDTFEIVKDGVDYSNLNTASKVKVGVDICLALQARYGLLLPIIIDDLEGLDNANLSILSTTGKQIIGAFVKND